jgi:hypothetical protein
MNILLALLTPVGVYVIHQLYVSLATGWYGLAKLYRTPVRADEKVWSGLMGMNDDVRGRHLTMWASLTAAPEGLYLSLPWFFSFLCPPLLIPWRDFALVPNMDLDDYRQVKLYLGNGDNMTVTKQAYLAMEPHLHHLPHRPIAPKAPAPSARIL